MSASKSASNARRRLSLLTGSSLAAACVLAGVGGVSLAPGVAFAANECGDPNANGATADTFVCTGTHAAITYPATNGNLTLQLQNNVTTTTGGLVVSPTGTNAVTVSRIADSPANSGDPSLTSTSGAGLQVTRATGGTITVNLTDNDTTDTPLVISGTTAGVRLQNAGTGATTFTSTNGTITASAGAGIDMSTLGTGGLTLTNGSTVTGTTAGARLRTTGTGAITVTNSGSLGASAGAGLDLGTTGTGNMTITNGNNNGGGVIGGATAAIVTSGGNNVTFNNGVTNTAGARVNGIVTLGNTGTTTMTNNGEWRFSGTSTLRDTATATGGVTLTNAEFRLIAAGEDAAASTIDFGIGSAIFNNVGNLVAGFGDEGAATLTLSGLQNWNNSGRVLFGADEGLTATDGVGNDRIVMSRPGGGTFTGSGASMLLMDVDFGASQLNCAAAITADCLDLRDQNTAGTTAVRLNVVGTSLTAHRIVLVDVAGAGADEGVFTLDPVSTGYRDVDGGVVDGGLFLYRLSHDTAAQQHVLTVASLDGEALELGYLPRQASEPWRVATGMWHDRQADLRNTLRGPEQGYAPGVWLKLAGGYVDETRRESVSIGAESLEFDISHEQETKALVGGVDLLRFVGDNRAWVLGVTAGKLESTVDYIGGMSVIEMDGHSLGAYASVLLGRAFFDAIVNKTDLDLIQSGFGAEFASTAESVGYQLEGGYRLFQINDDGAWLEPLASLTYVKTKVDDLAVGGLTAEYDDSASLRGALGLRLGGDLVMDAFTASFSATGRLWRELDGDGLTILAADFGDTPVLDERMDNLGELGVAVSLFTLGGRLSAHAAYNLLFNDDYKNTGASLGLRYNW